MEVVIDTSALLAVLMGEPERGVIIRITKNARLMAPYALHWEFGNALSAMMKKKRLRLEHLKSIVGNYLIIPLQFFEIDISAALEIAGERSIYAYDAYFLECARSSGAPLLTLDRDMMQLAIDMRLNLLEVV